MREVEDYPPFDHKANFQKKVKENWLSNEDFAELKSKAGLIELTLALIDYKMDFEYRDELMKLIDGKEPSYLKEKKHSEYILLVYKTPLENMKRIYNKYDNINKFIKSDWKFNLKTEIMKKERLENG